MIPLIIAIVILSILAIRHFNFPFRAIILVFSISSCCFLTYLEMISAQTEQIRQNRGHLNMYLGHPYEELFHHLAKLSVEDPEELKKAVLVLADDKNVALFRDTWLFYHDTGYDAFVQQLIAKGCKTNQVMNGARQNE